MHQAKFYFLPTFRRVDQTILLNSSIQEIHCYKQTEISLVMKFWDIYIE